MQYLKHPSTLIGTLGYGRFGQLRPQQHTTPPAGELQQKLAVARDRGDVFVAMEASSHALDQMRLAGCMIDVAVFTNLTHEHLDYHKTINDYLAAKQKLVMMNAVGIAIVNYDDPSGQLMIERTNKALWPCSMQSIPRGFTRWSYAAIQSVNIQGLVIKITTHNETVVIDSPLIGEFNAENLMYAHAALCLMGVKSSEAAYALGSIEFIPGRMQRVNYNELRCNVFIDYCHTPNALEKVLSSLDNIKSGRVWLVFGCGGNRDKKKRSMMGAISERLADEVVITEDNSRSELFQDIANDILSGMRCPNYAQVIESRYAAIKYALREAQENDIVLIAGKGHETFIENSEGVRYFSDEATVESILVE
jgi:UDP-N-acetylmuramoyl-L-alanyl-D-glutamate--2,6-diaminopimelate ligase